MDRQQLINHQRNNLRQSILLLGGMTALLALLGWLLAGLFGVVLAAGVVVFLVLSQRVSPRFILRMYRARQLSTYDAPGLLQIVHALAQRAELPALPRLYYIPSYMMNAFTVGQPEDAAIGITDGLLRRLERRELIGVLAHEISHIRNNDTWVMGLADVVSRMTSSFSLLGQALLLLSIPMMLMGNYNPPWLLVLLLLCAPTLSAMLQLALSRTREFEADLEAARLTGDPKGLASALAKLERYQRGFMERIFLPGRRLPDPSLLRTHPTTTERIERLLSLTNEPVERRPAMAHVSGEALLALAQAPQIIGAPRWRWSGLWY